MTDLVEVRSVEFLVHTARGDTRSAADVDALLEAARATRHVDVTTFGKAVAAAELAKHAPDAACSVLSELAEQARTWPTPYHARQLPSSVRAALAAGDLEVAERLMASLEPHYPLDEHALCTARAQRAEHGGKHEEAASLSAEAASRWQEFGNVPERAYALLGHGGCLRALGRAGAEEPLFEARELFASMGYEPALAEVETLLGQTALAPIS